jgi:translation initiation factor 4E
MESKNKYEFHKLDDKFSLWYHNPNDSGWELKNYTKLVDIKTAEEYWYYTGLINDKIVCFGMLFLMKNDVNPLWEDEANIGGGYISIKLPRDKTIEKWGLITNYFVSGNMDNNINGISITPKKNFNIIKIWFREQIDVNNYTFPDELNICDKSFMFRSHLNNIEKIKNT